MKVLVTGFDPFGGATINPAFEAVKSLPDVIGGAEIIKLEIPTVFGDGPAAVEAAMIQYQPEIVLCVGQAGGRTHIMPEFVGINFRDARIPDNAGKQPINEKIKADGDDAYFTKHPVKAMVQKMKEHGIPAAVSYTAGTYVCNDVMYSLLYMINKKYPEVRGGFVHVPYDASQAAELTATTPSMPITMICEGLTYAIEAIIEHKEDILVHGGETH